MSHKIENCAKWQQCFYCNSNKHDTELHICVKKTCVDWTVPCPHPSRYIIYNGSHMADYENCLLKPTYSKTQDAIIKRDKIKIIRICEHQKIIKDRLIRDNLVQIMTVRQKLNFIDTIPDMSTNLEKSNFLHNS